MSGVLLSCCNTGHRGGPFFLAYLDDRTSEVSWIKLDDIEVDLNFASGATGLINGKESCFVAIQGLHDPAAVLEFDHDFRFKRLISLPGVRDIHSIREYDGYLYATSTGTNELFEVDLRNPLKISCKFKCPTTASIPNVHLNDYFRHGGKEYVLGHSNPFAAQGGKKNSFIYSLTDEEVVIEKMEHAHTLLDIDGRLGVLDSARGRVVIADDGATNPWLQLDTGGILRGACQTDDKIHVAMSSRRMFSRKQGLLQVNVSDDQVVFGNEAFMSWLYCFDKTDRKSFTRVSLSEIAFEIYDLVKLERPPAPHRLVPNAAAVRAQAWRQQFFWLSRRSAQLGEDDDRQPPDRRRGSASPAPPKKALFSTAKTEEIAFWELPAVNNVASDPAIIPSNAKTSPKVKAPPAEHPMSPAIVRPTGWQETEGNFHIVAKSGSRKTVIAFAGLAQLIGGMTTYNFMSSLKDVDANVIFVRDPKRSWFNGPIEGIGRNSAEIGEKLASLASELDTSQLYLLGTSSGGFAALAYAKALKAKRVLAFGPQTNIAIDYLNSVGEVRWIKPISRIKAPSLIDTFPLLSGTEGMECHLVVGSRDKLDVVYAERLKTIQGVHLHYVDTGHNSAQFLRKAGLLSTLLEQFTMDVPLTIG
ncbi:hypothetical protein [Reyranella sp.]|uniref:hypothetical protein n=1 Tax=Reyranella sp. TaxID=1929291 RepID=UPI003BABB37D